MVAERRRSRRYPMGPDQAAAIVELEGVRHPARIVDVSAEGFGVAVNASLPLQFGQEVKLLSTAGGHVIRIVHREFKDGELLLGTIRLGEIAEPRQCHRARREFELPVPPAMLFAMGLVALVIAAAFLLKSCPDLLRFGKPKRSSASAETEPLRKQRTANVDTTRPAMAPAAPAADPTIPGAAGSTLGAEAAWERLARGLELSPEQAGQLRRLLSRPAATDTAEQSRLIEQLLTPRQRKLARGMAASRQPAASPPDEPARP